MNFLNYCIIQSSHGISIDQTDHICKNVLNTYFPDKTKQIQLQTIPFTLDSRFQTVIFHVLPLSNNMLQGLKEIFYGWFGHWVEALQYIQEKSCPGLGYSVIYLYGYLSTLIMLCA